MRPNKFGFFCKKNRSLEISTSPFPVIRTRAESIAYESYDALREAKPTTIILRCSEGSEADHYFVFGLVCVDPSGITVVMEPSLPYKNSVTFPARSVNVFIRPSES